METVYHDNSTAALAHRQLLHWLLAVQQWPQLQQTIVGYIKTCPAAVFAPPPSPSRLETLLMHAARYGYDWCVTAVLARVQQLPHSQEYINYTNKYGRSALTDVLSVKNCRNIKYRPGHTRCVELLLAAGASVEQPVLCGPDMYRSQLLYTVSTHNNDCTRLLLRHGALQHELRAPLVNILIVVSAWLLLKYGPNSDIITSVWYCALIVGTIRLLYYSIQVIVACCHPRR